MRTLAKLFYKFSTSGVKLTKGFMKLLQVLRSSGEICLEIVMNAGAPIYNKCSNPLRHQISILS